MNKPVSLVLVVVGAILLLWGIRSAESFASEVSEFFSGSPTNEAIWLTIGGVAALIFGIVGLSRGSRS